MEELKLVQIGECHVTAEPDTILETCLGSCVGVTIYDPVRHIGGMCHILLPDGPKEKKNNNPATYATTAIPLLLKKFEELGGNRKNAVVAIAGGASITKGCAVSDLNIGKRNLLAVMDAIKKEGLTVSYQQIGGNLGRVMRLKLRNGQIYIRTSKMPTKAEAQEKINEKWDKRTLLNSILKTAEELRPNSNVAIRALQLVNSDDTGIEELERLILQDQVLAANLLKEANAAYYGLSRQVHTISQAIAYLGMRTFKKIIMNTCLLEMYANRIVTYDMEDGAFFYHAVTCARISEVIAKITRSVEPERAYLAGLLHDIGKIVIERYGPETFTQVTSRVMLRNESFIEAERDVFGMDHAAIGQYIVRKWQLPIELEEAIAFHHEPEKMEIISPLTCIVHISNHICNIAGIGIANDSMNNGLHEKAISSLNLDEQDIEEILSTVPRIIHAYI